MRCTRIKERYAWAPVCFEIEDILLLLENTLMAELVVCLHGRFFWIGVACEYDRIRQLFGNQVFYIDDQEFATLEGDPMLYYHLVTEMKLAMGNGS